MSERRAPLAERPLTRRGFLAASAASVGALVGCSMDGAGVEAGALRPVQTILDDPAPEPERSEVTVLMVGDVLVHEGVWVSGERGDGSRDYEHLFAHVADQASGADVAIVDQETILGGTALGLSSYPTFNSPQEIGSAEAAAGFDVVLHANNHALDKGMEGIEAELAFWRSEHPEVMVTGMADSQEAADEVPILERGGRRIAVLAYTYGTNGIPLPSDAPWAVRMLDDAQVERDFSAAWGLGADAVVVCPHWGTEYAAVPDEGQRRWAERFVELGADVIIGCHPHVLQPVEELVAPDGRVVPVFWSLGNFVSGQARKDTMVGGLAQVTLYFEGDERGVASWRLTPLVTHRAMGTDYTTYPLAGYTEELAAANHIRTVSGQTDFSRQWCVDFCSERLGEGFDPVTCELVSAS